MKKVTLSSSLLPYQKNNRFYNHPDDHPESILFHTLPSFLASLKGRAKRLPAVPHEWIHVPQVPQRTHHPTITWLGHASFIIQINHVTILTDPIFGPLSWLFPRMIPSVITAQELPPIDMVLLSHNHPDHADIASLKQLPHMKERWFGVPQGDKQWMEKQGFSQVEEFMWWQQQVVDTPHGSVTVTFLPAHHWSARGLFDRNKSLWGSWMIQSGQHTIYFGGDTAYWHHFKEISRFFPSISMALLPIGPCEPAEKMQKTHMSPEQAIAAMVDLHAKRLVPMHWGSFPFGTDNFNAPLERLLVAWQKQQPAGITLDVIKSGQSLLV